MDASSPLRPEGWGDHETLDYGATSTRLGQYNDNDNASHGPEKDLETRSLRARFQIPLLCYVRMMEPLAFYTIFPYIAQMTKHNGDIPDTDVGFYSGVFESLFSTVQAVVLIFWGSMADRVGYKYMLVCSLCGMAGGPVLFGFSTSLWQMAVFRGMTGIFSGSNIIIRSMLMQLCTPETQARTFSWYTFADIIALFAGPLLGGALADPVSQYPAVFKGLSLFEHFPYALPGMVTGAVCASGAAVAVLFIDDSRKDSKEEPDAASGEREDSQGHHRPSIGKLIKAPGVIGVLCTLSHVKLLGSSMMAVSTTALYTPVRLGGMGYCSRQIATLIAAQGACETIWLLLVFPFLHRRVGTKGILYLCATMFPLVFADYGALNELLRSGSEVARAWYLVGLGGLVVFGSGVLMASASGQLALQNVSPDPQVLGTLNAVAESCSSIVKTVTPAASAAVFAIGVREQVLRGHLAWFILMLISPALFATTQWLPRGV